MLPRSRSLLAAALLFGASSQPIFALERPAAEILAEIDSIKASTPNAKNDPKLLTKLRNDPALREQIVAQQIEARRRLDDLTWSLYCAYPDEERLPALLQSRWMHQLGGPALADKTIAEIDAVLAETKSPRLAIEVAFLRAEAFLRRYHNRPANEFISRSMPAIEAAIARTPKDDRGAGFLYTLMTQAKGISEESSIDLGDRILRDYPDSEIARLVIKARNPRLDLGQPLSLDFQDAIGGANVSLGSLKGKVVVIDFWATWVPLARPNFRN